MHLKTQAKTPQTPQNTSQKHLRHLKTQAKNTSGSSKCKPKAPRALQNTSQTHLMHFKTQAKTCQAPQNTSKTVSGGVVTEHQGEEEDEADETKPNVETVGR